MVVRERLTSELKNSNNFTERWGPEPWSSRVWACTWYLLQQIKYGFGGLQLLPVDLAPLRILRSGQSALLLPFPSVHSTGQLERRPLRLAQGARVEVAPRRAFGALPRHTPVLAALRHAVGLPLQLFVGVFCRGQRLLGLGSPQSFEDHFEVRGEGVIWVLFFILS